MMNAYAASLGCTGTHFTNPHGLQDENHYTTPYDIYLMLKEALKYPEFTEITQLGSYTTSYKYLSLIHIFTGGSTRIPYIDNYLASYTGVSFNLSPFYEKSTICGLEKIIRDRDLRNWAQPVKQRKL